MMEWARADMNPDDPQSQGYSPLQITTVERALLARAARKWATAVENAAWAAKLSDEQFAETFADEPERLRALADRLDRA